MYYNTPRGTNRGGWETNRSWGMPDSGYLGRRRWGRRWSHLYSPVFNHRGWYGGGAWGRRRRDRRFRRWRSSEEARREEHRDSERIREAERRRITEEEARRARTLTVSALDFHVEENTQAHRTDDYDCTTGDPKQLVLRRGQEFKLTLVFDRQYNKAQDDLFFVFSPDDDDDDDSERGPLDEVFQLDEDRSDPYPPNHSGWAARIVESRGRQMTVRVHVAATCVIGEWDLRVRTRLREGAGGAGGDGDDFDYDVPQSVIVLFNPWSSGDQVYFPENPDQLEEYVLNEDGMVFRSYPSDWYYGQLSGNMLALCLSVLRKAFRFRMTKAMGDAVIVSRALSAIVNAPDDNGVVVGKWDGNYRGGIKPTDWKSSPEILRKFEHSGPVKYGQCWVFSHVLTAVCRALGLPTRSVTNYDSAHDTEGSCTIDYYFSEDGDVIEGKRTDSVWNFHVWNEVWIMRPDLKGDYDGWHVIDSTPQETSQGKYQCGPCPVKAVKRGEVEVKYDTRFVFAEVNADVVHWARAPGGFEVVNINTREVGNNITTKHPYHESAQDITSLYKFPEDSPAERAAVEKAVGKGRYGDKIYKDLQVWFEKDAGTTVGKDLGMFVMVKNMSNEVRTVDVSMTARATHYWNHVHGSRVLAKRSHPKKTIGPGQTLSFQMAVTFQQYHGVCDDLWSIRGFARAKDHNGGRFYTAERHYTLLTPPLHVSGPERAYSGQAVTVSVSLTNPLPVGLTNCSLHMDGSLTVAPDDPHPWATQDGTMRTTFRAGSGVRPSERVMITLRLVGKWDTRGTRRDRKSMMLSFDCDQLGAMTGVYHLTRVR